MVSENGITRGDGRVCRPRDPRLNESPGKPGIQPLETLISRSRPVDLDRFARDVAIARVVAASVRLASVSLELPRKEVIQPQVPLRLPCYDFTPITGQTLGGSLPCGLGYRLLVPPAFVV